MGQYKVYSEEEKRWITLPMAFQGEQGVKGEPGDDGVTPMFKIVSGMWNVSYDNGRTWGEVGPANGTSINDVQAIVDSSTGTPSASASYSGPDNARTLTFRFSGLKGETGPKGADGADGKDGKDGVDGAPGKDGVDGKDGSGRTIFIYTYTDTLSAPATPEGGDWDPESNTITCPKGWEDNSDELTTIGNYLWMSYASFNGAGTNTSGWQKPIRLTGENGQPGTDGTNIEFIFRLVSNKSVFEKIRDNWDDWKPTKEGDVITTPDSDEYKKDSVWTNDATGIDGEEFSMEIVSSRCKTDNKWTEWSKPSPWSMWGEDGQDGAGVEYIFLITPDKYEGTNGSNDMTSTIVKNNYMPDQESMLADSRYQEFGFIPNNDFGYNGYDWTDEPSDVGPTEPLEWVCIRRYTLINGVMKWGPFSEPKVWARYAQDGYSYKTSYVFTRSATMPDLPTGGNYETPRPTNDDGTLNEIWKDTVTEGHDILWMSMRTFRSDNYNVDKDWSEPRQMTDTANFQVEFTSTDLSTKSYTPSNFGNYASKNDWRAAEAKKGVIWSDNVPNALYMATATCHNGVWSDWAVVKIKGEKGDTGDPGSSVYIEGKFETLTELKAAWTKFVNREQPSGFTGTLDPGDGYFVEEDGYLYVYSGGWSQSEGNNEFETYWVGVELKGEKGEPGSSAYIYVRFSNDGGSSFTDNNGLTPGKYIGILFGQGELDKNTINTPTKFTWHLWNGEDGWGYEQIFLLTTNKYDSQKPVPVPTDNTFTPEYLPDHNLGEGIAPGNKWCDSPQTPTKEYPYCWVVTRTRQGNSFGDWGGKNKYASIYSRYTFDGKSAYHLELSNDQAIIPLENGIVDPDFNNEVSTQMTLYAGDKAVPSGVTYSTDDLNGVSTSDGKVTVNLETFDIDNTYIVCKAKYNEEEYTRKFYIHKTNNAYELTPNKGILRRNAFDGYFVESDKEVSVEVKKWNGTKWSVPNSKSLFAKLTYLDQESKNIGIASVNWNDGIATFNFSDESYVSNIKFYLTDDNLENGNKISFEDVGVVANGEDGPGEEFIYYLCNVDFTDSDEYILKNPTPIDSEGSYDINYSDSDGSYQDADWSNAVFEGIKWTDNPSGVSSSDKYEYVSVRKKKNGVWQEFSDPTLWAKYGENGESGQSAWSWRLSDPIEMISYNSVTGQPNSTISSITKVLANYGGTTVNPTITGVTLNGGDVNSYGKWNKDAFTLESLPADGNSFNFIITASAEYNGVLDTATLSYTVKKWFGEPATVSVHLGNDNTPVPTDSEGKYTNDIVRSSSLTASNGKNTITINSVSTTIDSNSDNKTVIVEYNNDTVTVTVTPGAIWTNDVLNVPLICELDDGYPNQQVSMEFYKVRAAKEAEYPTVYDLIVSPTSIRVDVNSEGNADYINTEIIPTIIEYTPTGGTVEHRASEYYEALFYSFDGDSWKEFKEDSDSIVVNGDTIDADEYVDIKFVSPDGITKIERIQVTHEPLPNIDWELVLGCPDRILYDSNKQIIGPKPVISCNLFKTMNNKKVSVDSVPFGFDVKYSLDGGEPTSYNLGTVVEETFEHTCEFILVNQSEDDHTDDEIHDRKLITKEYAAANGNDAKFSIFRIYNQMDQIYVGPDDLTVADQTFVTKTVLVTEDGEQSLPENASVSVSGIANTEISYNDDELSVRVAKGTYVPGDISLNITYDGNQTQSMYLKRIKGFTEYSLKSDELFVAVGTEKLTATIVEKVIGSDILTELTEIPSGFTTIWKYGDTSVNNGLEFDSSELKENDQVTLSLYKGIDLVDSMTFEVISEATTGYIINNSVDQVYLHKHRLRSRIDNEDYSAWNFSIQKFEDGGHTDITSCEINSVKVTAYDVNDGVINDLTDNEYIKLNGNTILSPSLNHWFIDRVTTRINKNVDVTLWHRESTKFFDELLKGNVEKVSKIEVEFQCVVDGADNTFAFTLNVLGSEEDYDIVFNDITISDTPTFYVTSGKVYINKAYEFIDIGHYNISGEYDVSRKVPMGYRVMVGYDNVWTTYSEGAKIDEFKPTEDVTYTIKLEKQYSDSPLFGQSAIRWKLIDQVDVYPMHIDYDIRLDNTFALVHLNPDGTIANGNTVSTAIKVLAAGVEEKNWSLVSDNESEGLYIDYGNNVIAPSLDGGVLTFNFAEDKTLTNKTITLRYRKNLGKELIEVASATITLESDSPYVDYDLVSDVYTITDLGNTYKPSTFKLSILEKIVGSNNTIKSLNEPPTGYSVKIDGTSADISTQISIPRDHNNMDPIKVQLWKDDTVADQVEINIVKTHGERGLMLYPAGEWNSETIYKIDNNAAPYVLCNEVYYVLVGEDSSGYKDKDPSDSNNSAIWQKMETFKSVYTDVIVSKYGNIGGAVFMDYTETIDENNEVVHNIMFSLQGKANGDNGSEKYTDFLKSKNGSLQNSQWDTDLFTTIKTDSKFIPNVLIDFTTGDAWFGGGDTILSGNGTSDMLLGNMTKFELLNPIYPQTLRFQGNEYDHNSGVVFSNPTIAGPVLSYESTEARDIMVLFEKYEEYPQIISSSSITLNIDLTKCTFNNGTLELNDLWKDGNPNFDAMHLWSNTSFGSGDNTSNRAYMTFSENEGFGDPATGFEAYITNSCENVLNINSPLYVDGAVIAYGFSQTSDERLKDFFDDVSVDLDTLRNLNKKYFKYKNNNLPTQLGMSAQEVQKIYPEIVSMNNGYLGIDYSKLSVIALKAIDILHDKNQELEARLLSLEAKLNS